LWLQIIVEKLFYPPSFGVSVFVLDPGSEIRGGPGWIKIRIRDKQTGSATVITVDMDTKNCAEGLNGCRTLEQKKEKK
jgi:hypothetical protein